MRKLPHSRYSRGPRTSHAMQIEERPALPKVMYRHHYLHIALEGIITRWHTPGARVKSKRSVGVGGVGSKSQEMRAVDNLMMLVSVRNGKCTVFAGEWRNCQPLIILQEFDPIIR